MRLKDGDFIDLDWCGQLGPIVLILHGLTGSSNSKYARGLQSSLHQENWRSVIMNFRGCSGEPNHSQKGYHSGITEDLTEILQHLHTQEPETPIFVVGYSLGGNVLLKWLGESGQQELVTAATAVSVPFQLAACEKKLNSGLSKIYRQRFLRELSEYLQHKKNNFALIGDHDRHKLFSLLEQLDEPSTLWEFDEKFTAPLHGFDGADHYYNSCSSGNFLDQIKTPTLIIQANNDPVTDNIHIPLPADLPSQVSLEVYPHGGHVGFISGNNPFKPVYWLEQRIPNFLTQFLP